MIDIIFIIVFIAMAFRISRTVFQESAVFTEFEQSRSLGVVALLFPLGPVVLMALPFREGWLPAVIVAVACYLPAMIISRHRLKVYSRSGTDRTQRAEQAAHHAFGTSLTGFVYIAIFLTFVFAGNTI